MNPVLRKDILTLLRLKRIAAIEILFVVVLAAVVMLSWPQGGVLSMSASSQDDLLLGLIMGQLVALILAVPGVAAASITGEREANTLEMLYASRLTAWKIVWGKVMSAVGFPIVLILAGLPFVGLLNFRGAVNAEDLEWAYLILGATAVFLAVLSLTVSALCRQTSTALVVSYLVVIVVCGGVMVPAAIMLDSSGGMTAAVLHDARALSPIAAVLSLLRPDMPGDFAGMTSGNPASYRIFFLMAGATVVGCLLILVARLRRPPAETERTPEEKSKPRTRPMGLLNPIWTKERRTNHLSSGRWMVRIFYGMLVLSLALALMGLSGGAEHPDLLRYVFQVLVAFQIIGMAAVAPSLTTATISGEIERGTFESLRLTPLRGRQIFWGKLLPALLPAILPVIALLPAYGMVCYLNIAYLQYVIHLMPVVLLAMVFCCVLGMLCSSFAGNSARATVVAYIIVSAIMVLPMLGMWGSDTGLIANQHLIEWISMPSPLVTGLSLAPMKVTLDTHAVRSMPLLSGMRVVHEWFMAAVCVVMLVVARMRLGHLLRQG